MMRRFLPLAALGLTTACAASAPPPAVPKTMAAGGSFAALPVASIAPVPDDWWRLYDDPVLDRLVAQSLAANADLRVAYANLDGARAALRQAQAARLPATAIESGLTLDDTRNQPSANAVPSTDWDIGLMASWDIDLFGRLRATATAAAADAAAQAA
ncbi:MAG: TolC family protein, partial [Sphingobium sp.]